MVIHMTKRRVKPEHERREEIVNAAFEVFMRSVYRKPPSLKLQKAQVSTGIVSHYFGDKQG